MISKISKVTNNLADLPAEVTIVKAVQHEHSTELFITYPRYEDVLCPECNSDHHVSNGSSSRTTTVRHSITGSRGILLTFTPYRYKCKDCGKSYTERPYFIHPRLSISKHMYLLIWSKLSGTVTSVHDVAVSTFTTSDIVKSVMDELVQDIHPRLPQTLCIDEFKGSSGVWNSSRKRYDINKYHCNVSDSDSGSVFDILPTIDYASLKSYFFQYSLEERSKVRFVCCDMHAGFAKLVGSCFPRAVVCYDNFHIIKMLNDRMSDIRIRMQNEYRSKNDNSTYTLLKHSEKLLSTAVKNQDDYWKGSKVKMLKRLNRIFELAPDISEMYDTVQQFHVIFNEHQFHIKRLMLLEWIDTNLSSEIPEVRKAAKSVQRHKKGIINAWKYGKTNAPCEGINRKIKEIKRNACGMHVFEHFRMRILLACGPIRAEQSTYALTNEKSS